MTVEPATASAWLGFPFRGLARQVASLVLGLTRAVFELGAGGLLVGRTRYCVRPAGEVDWVEAVSGRLLSWYPSLTAEELCFARRLCEGLPG